MDQLCKELLAEYPTILYSFSTSALNSTSDHIVRVITNKMVVWTLHMYISREMIQMFSAGMAGSNLELSSY